MAQQIEIYSSVNMNFSEQIIKSINQSNIPRNIYVESYLVALLSKFIEKEEDFLSNQPLIYRYNNSESLEDYIKLGDETLFVMGFFPETVLKNKSEEYVINIGKGSYFCAAIKLDYKAEGQIYGVLAKKFKDYSDILNDVKYNMLEKISDQEFFQMYKNWKNYNNQRAAERIKRE